MAMQTETSKIDAGMRMEPKGRILHILDHSLPLHSGYAFRSESIFHAQTARGWQVAAVTSPRHQQGLSTEGKIEEEIGGTTYFRAMTRSYAGPPGLPELTLMFALARRLQCIVNGWKPDILHAHSPILNAIPALWVARRNKLAVVYEIRAFWEDAAVDHGTYAENSWKYRLIRMLETFVCRRVDSVTVLCNGIRQDLIKRGIPPEKLSIVSNGINSEKFVASPPDVELEKTYDLRGKKVIGFLGSFYRYEGLDLLVDAFSTLTDRFPDCVLLLVGGGEMEAFLRKQANTLGLTHRVIIPGRIAHHRMPGVYALMDILVYPRYSMRLTELTTPLKPLEAMAMGRALIASDVGGHRELIRHGENGILFQAGNRAALADSLLKLLSDDNMRRRLSAQGREWVLANHPWEKTTSVYTDIYARLLQ